METDRERQNKYLTWIPSCRAQPGEPLEAHAEARGPLAAALLALHPRGPPPPLPGLRPAGQVLVKLTQRYFTKNMLINLLDLVGQM